MFSHELSPFGDAATFNAQLEESTGALPNTGGAEVWQRYYQSARLTRGKMMINLDLSATAFYEGGSLVQIDLRSPDDLRRGLSERKLKEL
ncbi:hypothetical protein C1646_811954 [Rhizophagus diaphanus]|nr:hypothetical protein C1646_811954 [Rhizophagus diaphanus] [Rhizophagus sp. MUCL 43196]